MEEEEKVLEGEEKEWVELGEGEKEWVIAGLKGEERVLVELEVEEKEWVIVR